MRSLFRRAYQAAAGLTGRRFGIVVGSSIIATSAIVASAMTAGGPSGLGGLLGKGLIATAAPSVPSTAAPPAPAPAPSPAPVSGSQARSVPVAAPASTAPASSPAPTPSSTSIPTTKTAPLGKAGRVKHVFVLSLSSPGYDAAFGPQATMPYLATTLRPQGELLTNYSLLTNAALPNDIAMVSGQAPNPLTEANCSTYAEFPTSAAPNGSGRVPGSGCVYPVLALSLADQLGSARFSWHAYMEDMGNGQASKSCVHPSSGQPDTTQQPVLGNEYATRHNPFVYFHSLLDLGDCATNDLPLDQLSTDLKSAKATPNYSFISPNLCHFGSEATCADGQPGGAASADQFLSQWVPQILSSPAYKRDGVLIVTFAEPATPDPSTTTPQVGTLLISKFLSPGATRTTPYNPYSLLRSVEDLFGLQPLAGARGHKVKSFAPQLLGSRGSGD